MRVDHVFYGENGPVDEATARSLAVSEVLKKPIAEHLDAQQTNVRYALGLGIGGVVLGLFAFVLNVGALLGAALLFGGLVTAGGGYAYFTGRSPDVTVTGIEKGYWTSHCIPVEDGTVVYDATDSFETTSFELQRLTDDDVVASAEQRLDELQDFPVVMPREGNVEEAVAETMEEVKWEIESADQHVVEAPIVPSDGPEASAVEFFASRADPGEVELDVDVSSVDAREDIEALDELERMAATDDTEAELESLSEVSRTLANDLSGLQETAIDLLNDHVGTAADAFGMVSYNFYCPDCQADDVESTVELADAYDGEWYCPTCRTHHATDVVIPRHRLKDDLVNPVWDQLWIEKDDQRREIYENIEDQKADLQEREFEQRREEIRSATDRIRDLRSRIRDLKTDAKAAQGKVTQIGELMVKYEHLHRERKREFEREVESSFATIDEETRQILDETRNEEQERIDRAQEAAQEKAELMREEERRREVEKFVAQQQLENARKSAELEQRAALHDEELDVEKRHHRENWMLETRGRTSFSGLIDKGKMKKDRIVGASVRENGGGD